MKLREYTDEDADQVFDLHVRTIREINRKDYSAEDVEQWIGSRSVEGVIASRKKVDDRFVVEEDGVILGFADRKLDEVTGLYVSADAQGRGVGSMLLEKVLACIHNDGFLCARVISSITARSFYEKHGFVCIKRFIYYGNSASLDSFILQKLL